RRDSRLGPARRAQPARVHRRAGAGAPARADRGHRDRPGDAAPGSVPHPARAGRRGAPLHEGGEPPPPRVVVHLAPGRGRERDGLRRAAGLLGARGRARGEALLPAGRHEGDALSIPRFGLNRFDSRSVDAFAADVRRAEGLGWDAALQPDSQLRRRDTYVLLAAAARATERITLGTLLAN